MTVYWPHQTRFVCFGDFSSVLRVTKMCSTLAVSLSLSLTFYSNYMRAVLAHSHLLALIQHLVKSRSILLSLLRKVLIAVAKASSSSVVFYDHCMRNVFLSLHVHHFSSFEHIQSVYGRTKHTYIPSSPPSVVVCSAHFHSVSCFA